MQIENTESAEVSDSQPSEGTTQSDDSIDIFSLSDSELAALEESDGESLGDEDSQEPDEQTDDADQELPLAASDKADDSTQEEDSPEDNSEEQSQETPEQRIEKLKKQLADSQKFISERSATIGELRKQLKTERERLVELTGDDAYLENPGQALDAKLALKDTDKKLQQLDKEEKILENIKNAEQTVHAYVKPEEWNPEAMAEVLLSDGADPNVVNQFLSNPYASDPTGGRILVQLAKRASDRVNLKKVAAYALQLKKQVEESQKKLETEKGSKKTFLKNIERNLSSPSEVTSKTGGSSKVRGNDFDTMDLVSMSPEALAELEEQLAAQE